MVETDRPITQAIVFGIIGNFATDTVKAAYNVLHTAIALKFGKDSDIVEVKVASVI